MKFSETDNIYRIIRIIYSQNNILGVTFDDKNKSHNNIVVIECDFPKIYKNRIRTSKDEVLEQILSELKSVNQFFGTNYKLFKLYFSLFEISTNRVYSGLIAVLIRYYHSRNKFKEV